MEDFRQRLTTAGLGRVAAELEALVRPSVRLRAAPTTESAVPCGASKLGGRPDLPDSVAWPVFQGLSQSFVAQIDLREVHGIAPKGVLPADGLLSFFYDAEQETWGFDPADRGAWAVIYTPHGARLEPRQTPPDVPGWGRFIAGRIAAEAEPTKAPWELSEVEALGLTDAERDAYAELTREDGDVAHRLLGHPQPIQGDMQLECQLVSHGLYCGDSTGYDDPRAERLAPGAVDWRLLLQVDSDEALDMAWGDGGRIYYWLRRDALAARRWDEAWLVLQCF
jgi:uncharacterized protein YwqG